MRLFTLAALILLPLAAARDIQPSQEDIARAKQDAGERRSLPPVSRHARMTNARRLKLGLPIMRPRNIPARTGTPTIPQIIARASASPSPSSAPSGSPSSAPAPPSFQGNIAVSAKANGTFLGYLSKNFIEFGEFGPASNIADALVVNIAGLRPGLNGPVDIVSSDPDAAFPFVGGIQGFASTDATLKSGSFNYAYVGGVLHTPPHSPPDELLNAFTSETAIAESTESAIWNVNTVTGEVTASWINPDGKAAPTQLALFVDDSVFVMLGDSVAFTAEFDAPVLVTFTLVPQQS